MPQGKVLGPLLFLVYVNDIRRNIDWSVRHFADGCIIYKETVNKNDTENFQKDLNTLGELVVENGMKRNLGKSKAIGFTRTGVKSPLGYSFGDQEIARGSTCKQLGVILRSDLNRVDQINYIEQNTWQALHFVMRILKKEINYKRCEV